jgi:ribonuclease HI
LNLSRIQFVECHFSLQPIASDSDYLGYRVTNNQAEYKGLINGLDYMVRNSISCNKLFIKGDSKLVIKQMEGHYRVKSNNLKAYHNEAKESLGQVEKSSYVLRHVPREQNTVADSLANQAIQRGD